MPNETESQWDQAGWATYAAIMLFGTGLVGIVNGAWALRYNDTETTLVLAEKNLELWGLVAVLGGLLLLATGIGAFYGKIWARWTGIVLAVLGIVWNVAWSEVQPTQSLIGAMLFASVVYALATTPVTVNTSTGSAIT
jgi:hypothetical protein